MLAKRLVAAKNRGRVFRSKNSDKQSHSVEKKAKEKNEYFFYRETRTCSSRFSDLVTRPGNLG